MSEEPKKIWHPKHGIIEQHDMSNLKEVGIFRIGKVYFHILQNEDTGEYESGWWDEHDTDEMLEQMDRTRADVKDIHWKDIL